MARLRTAATALPGLMLVAAAACDSPPPTSRQSLEAATYLATDGTVTLENGVSPAGLPDGVDYELLLTAEGDLDFDGELDAAVVLVERDGMSELYRLHAVLGDGRNAEDVAARLMGDRIGVRRVSIDNGLIRADLLVRSPGDPITVSPSVTIPTYYALTHDGLVPVVRMAVSAAGAERAAPSDATPNPMGEDGGPTLYSHEWTLVAFEMGDWSAAAGLAESDRPPSLQFVPELSDPAGASGQMNGYTGCNRVFGRFRAEESASLRLSGLGTTRRACSGAVGDFEQRLLAAFGSIESYAVESGMLEIAFVGGTLRFEAGGTLSRPEADASTPDENAAPPETDEAAPRRT